MAEQFALFDIILKAQLGRDNPFVIDYQQALPGLNSGDHDLMKQSLSGLFKSMLTRRTIAEEPTLFNYLTNIDYHFTDRKYLKFLFKHHPERITVDQLCFNGLNQRLSYLKMNKKIKEFTADHLKMAIFGNQLKTVNLLLAKGCKATSTEYIEALKGSYPPTTLRNLLVHNYYEELYNKPETKVVITDEVQAEILAKMDPRLINRFPNFEIIIAIYQAIDADFTNRQISYMATYGFDPKIVNRHMIIRTRGSWTKETYQKTLELDDKLWLEYLIDHDCPQ